MKHSERCSRLATMLKEIADKVTKALPFAGQGTRMFEQRIQARLGNILGDACKLAMDVADDKYANCVSRPIVVTETMQQVYEWIDYLDNHPRGTGIDTHLEKVLLVQQRHLDQALFVRHRLTDGILSSVRAEIDACILVNCNHATDITIIDAMMSLDEEQRTGVLQMRDGREQPFIYEESDDD